MTVENAYNEFIITQKLKGNSEKTVAYYSNCIKPLIKYFGGDFDISFLNVSEIRRYSLYLSQKDISSNSFKTYLKGVKVFLSWLYSEEYITENLGEKLKLPKAQRKTIDTLTENEIEQLFKSFDTKTYLGLRNYCICALMLDSGLRKSEVVALKLRDIHISEGYIIVNGKGNKQRIVPIGLTSQKHLIKYIAQRPASVKSDALFLTKDFTPITGSVISRLFRNLQTQKVGQGNLTSRIHAHLLRHTFATMYLENGGNIYALQQILGHTSLEMVKKYVHLTQAKTVVNFKDYSPLDNLK